jgi:Na+/H+ antiporter NhaD/arsenite permease-like protein
VTVAMMVLFFAGQPVAKVAIDGGALLLFTRRVKADKVYREIDWPLLLMFVGLFIVVTGLERTVLTTESIATVSRLDLETAPSFRRSRPRCRTSSAMSPPSWF